jgi:hypothetical protein
MTDGGTIFDRRGSSAASYHRALSYDRLREILILAEYEFREDYIPKRRNGRGPCIALSAIFNIYDSPHFFETLWLLMGFCRTPEEMLEIVECCRIEKIGDNFGVVCWPKLRRTFKR